MASKSARRTSGVVDNARGVGRDVQADEELPGLHPSKQPAGGGRIAKVLPVREDGRIVVHHYSRGARDVLSTHFVGTGIEGAYTDWPFGVAATNRTSCSGFRYDDVNGEDTAFYETPLFHCGVCAHNWRD